MLYRRSDNGILLKAIPPSPILRLPFKECTHRAEITFMPQEVGLLFAFRPEVDGVGKSLDGLAVAADEGAAEVDVLEVVLFALEIGDLTDVVTAGWVSMGGPIFMWGGFGAVRL